MGIFGAVLGVASNFLGGSSPTGPQEPWYVRLLDSVRTGVVDYNTVTQAQNSAIYEPATTPEGLLTGGASLSWKSISLIGGGVVALLLVTSIIFKK